MAAPNRRRTKAPPAPQAPPAPETTVGNIPVRIPLLTLPRTSANQLRRTDTQIATTVVSSFQRMLEKNPELRSQFVTVYNNGDDTNLTKFNVSTVVEVARQAYRTAISGSNQSESYSVQRFIASIRLAYFHAVPLSMPPLRTTDSNAFYAHFLIMLYVLSTRTREDYEKITTELSVEDADEISDFDRINRNYILNTNFIILYLIHLKKLYQQMAQYVANFVKPFIANLDKIITAIENPQNRNSKKTSNNQNKGRPNVQNDSRDATGAVFRRRLSTRFTTAKTVKFLKDFMGDNKSSTFVQQYSRTTTPNFSELFYVCYTVGMAINMIRSVSPTLIKQIYEQVPELKQNLNNTDIFARSLTMDTTEDATPTVLDALSFLTIKYDNNRTRIVSFLTRAVRLCDIVPTQVFPEINISKFQNNDIKTLSDVYGTFWFKYANYSRFMKEMVLRSTRAVASTECPSICGFYTKPQDYKLVIPKSSPSSTFIFGFENNQEVRQQMVQQLGAAGMAEIEPILYMVFKHGQLHYVANSTTMTGFDYSSLVRAFNDKTKFGLYINDPDEQGYISVEMKTRVKTDYGNSKNFNASNFNNRDPTNYANVSAYTNEEQTGGDNGNNISGNTRASVNALNKIIKTQTKISKSRGIAKVPLVFKFTNPTEANNYQVIVGGLLRRPEITVRRIYLGDFKKRNKLNKFKVEGWIVAVKNVDVAIIEYVKKSSKETNPNKDLIFNITMLSLEGKPSIGLLLTPVVLLMAKILADRVYNEIHKNISTSGFGKILTKQMESIKASVQQLGDYFSKSHDYTPDNKVSVTDLLSLEMFSLANSITCT